MVEVGLVLPEAEAHPEGLHEAGEVSAAEAASVVAEALPEVVVVVAAFQEAEVLPEGAVTSVHEVEDGIR